MPKYIFAYHGNGNMPKTPEEGGGPNPIMGFTEVIADDLDAALVMAQASPFPEMGTIEVAEIIHM